MCLQLFEGLLLLFNDLHKLVLDTRPIKLLENANWGGTERSKCLSPDTRQGKLAKRNERAEHTLPHFRSISMKNRALAYLWARDKRRKER